MTEILKADLHDCRHELEQLREMIAGLTPRRGVGSTSSATDERFDRLARALDQTAQRPDLGSLESEHAIDRTAIALRRLILSRAHEHSDPHFRSPLHDSEKLLPQGKRLDYAYERSLEPAVIEDKIARSAPALPSGWSARHVAFSSGMAAITGTLQCWQRTLRSMAGPARLGVWGGYYETRSLLNVMRGSLFEWEDIDDIERALAGGAFDALFIEPVRYDWDLSAFDLVALGQAWRTRSGRKPVIIFDSTLSSFTFPLPQVLQDLGADAPPLVIELRSGLKLDQQGLELANLGTVSVYFHGGEAGGDHVAVRSAEEFAHFLEITRAVSGTSLSLDAVAALDVPFTLDAHWTRSHAGQVFQRNREAAAVLAGTRGLFQKIAHPSLGQRHGERRRTPANLATLTEAPFVVCHLEQSQNTAENHGLLLRVLRSESRRQQLCVAYGASFGFRSHRFESIFPGPGGGGGLFKVAMGSRGGPSARAVLHLLSRVAAFPDFAALRDAYPEHAEHARREAAAWEAAIRDKYADFPER